MIGGCVLKRSGANVAALANASVRLSKLWIQAPPAGSTVQPEPPTPGVFPPPPWDPPVGAVWPPMYADFPKGSAIEVEDRPVDGAMPPKTILDDAPPGTVQLRLSDASGLALGDVVAIDADDDGRREIVEVTTIALTGAATDWARITSTIRFSSCTGTMGSCADFRPWRRRSRACSTTTPPRATGRFSSTRPP